MPESTCLHIQDLESGPIRVVDIPWISVRIGRAAFCEVRLTSDDMPDEACRLYRRGRSWHLVPVGGKGKISIEGRSVTAACALPFDATFRIGRHCLTLRQDRTVDPDWEMYPGPVRANVNRTESRTKSVEFGQSHTGRTASVIESQPMAEASLKPEWRPDDRAVRPVPTAAYGGAASGKDRWETRWRGAGAEIKARGDRSPAANRPSGVDFKAGIDSVPIKEPPVPRAQPVERPRIEPPSRPIPTTPPIPTPPRVAKVKPTSPIVGGRLEAGTNPREERCEPRCRPGQGEAPPEPAAELGSLGGSPSLVDEIDARTPDGEAPPEPAAALGSLGGSPSLFDEIDAPTPDGEAPSEPSAAVGSHGGSPSLFDKIDAPPPDGEAPSEPAAALGSLGGSPSLFDEIDAPTMDGEAPSEPAAALGSHGSSPSLFEDIWEGEAPSEPASEDESSYTTSLLDDEPHTAGEASWYEAPALPPPRQSRPPRPGPSVRKRALKEAHTPESDRAKSTVNRGKKGAEGRSVASPRPRTGGEPRPLVANRPEPGSSPKLAQMPSAKDILATHRSRTKSQPTSVSAGRLGHDATPTLAREPDQWTLPAWIAGPPATAFVLAIGLAGGILSWWWTADSYSVGIMTRVLMAADRRPQRGPLPESIGPPDGTWARSTAQHLAQWAIFMTLTEPGKASTPEDALALASRALEVSPLNPTARLALAQLDQNENGATISPRGLGMSRDLVSLSWSARRLLAAGNKDNALNMYRKSLALLTPDEPFHGTLPQFSDDPNVSRYLLPGEERVRAVVRELISRNDWAFREWSAVLPKSPTSSLAAARLLKEQSKGGEADVLLDLLMEGQEPREQAKRASALDMAARAEAFALKSRWKDSEQAYRRAIELIDDDTIKRSWWFNLADVELRLDDDSQRQTALRAAVAVSNPDEISRRATDVQRANNMRPPIRPQSVRAN